MTDHLARARLLLAQSRAAEAEQEAMAALAAEPENPFALAVLALSRVDQQKGPIALEAARQAVGIAPDEPYFHYVHALVLHRLDRDKEALAAAQETLRLDPDDADHHALLASIYVSRREWPLALQAAEEALALQPEHVGAVNLRAIALTGLGRKEEAAATVDFALQRAPENAFSHSNQGWVCLHRNDPKQARVHFLEALRLQPDLEHARMGLLEALKATNPVYRGMLAYFLWSGRLRDRYQWAFLAGLWFGGSFLRGLAASHPEQAWFWWSLLVVYYLFVYLTWTAQPMFNLMLRLHPLGKEVLSQDQKVATNWFALTFGGALASLIWWRTSENPLGLLCLVYLAILSMCVAATFNRTGKTRKILVACTLGLAATAVGSVAALQLGNPVGLSLQTLFVAGFVGFQIAANVLASRSR
jgi:tetratricopeptide (TPR) repeat protein